MATHTHTTPPPSPDATQVTPGRRSLFATAAALLAATPLAAAAGSAATNDHAIATAADHAALDFEPILAVKEGMPTLAEWTTQAGHEFNTFYFAAAALTRTPDELAAAASAAPDATGELCVAITNLRERLEGEAEILRTAELRIIAGACRAGLA